MAEQIGRGVLLVVSSPSGAGKTTLCHRLIAEFERITFSVSFTTRPRRPNERDGVDYFFVDDDTFEEMVERGEFAEWAVVHGNRYGTTWGTIKSTLDEGSDLIFDIDWQGGLALKQSDAFGQNTVMVFVLPPSLEELARRLKGRGTDAPDVVQRRLDKAQEELAQYHCYDYLVVNDELDKAYDELRSVYVASRSHRKQRGDLVAQLLSPSAA